MDLTEGGNPFEVLQPFVGDRRIAEVEGSEILQPRQQCQAIVINSGPVKRQVRQLPELGDVFQAFG